MNPKLVVFVNGGLVQEILSNVPVDVFVIDSDVDGCDRTRTIREWDFKNNRTSEDLFDVFDGGDWEANVNEPAVDHYFSEMLAPTSGSESDKEEEMKEHADEVVSKVQGTEGEGE